MKLRELVAAMELAPPRGGADPDVTGLALDSRRVRPGDVFFALAGEHEDGARFASAAVAAGAVAVVARRETAAFAVPTLEAEDARLALARAACRFHGDPSRSLQVVAVTGTNGKTTTTYLLEAIFAAAGLRTGVIGTTGIHIDGEARPSAFTTPEAPELQRLLAEMRARGVRAVALEASSHALVQRRTWGLACDVAVFTNFTQDHLDFHRTMDAYLDAKLMLLDGRNGGAGKSVTAVVNADDPAAAKVIEAARRGGAGVITFGLAPAGPQGGGGRHVSVSAIEPGPDGLSLEFRDDARPPAVHVLLPMLGRFNAHNAAGAWASARALGIGPPTIVAGLESCRGVPGRLERVGADRPFTVVVDYAHTPDALERSLAACREHAAARVLCVFGCGGDRDRGKRPVMGATAARTADLAWVTNDNPRSEDPAAIAREIVAGAPAGGLRIVLDRRAAIAAALAEARTGDLVLIAGKGHESTQTIGAQVLPFDDREVARELLGPPR